MSSKQSLQISCTFGNNLLRFYVEALYLEVLARVRYMVIRRRFSSPLRLLLSLLVKIMQVVEL